MVMISGHCLVMSLTTFLVDVFQFVPTMSYGLTTGTKFAQSADIVNTTSETHYRNTPDYFLMEWCVVCHKQILVLVVTTGSWQWLHLPLSISSLCADRWFAACRTCYWRKEAYGACYHSLMKYGFVLLKIHRPFFIFIILVGLRLTKHVIGQYQSLIGGPWIHVM